MNYSNFYLCAVPKLEWDLSRGGIGLNIAQFATDALDCERRIAKAVNLKNEYHRYTILCNYMEDELLTSNKTQLINTSTQFGETLNDGKYPVYKLADGYLSFLNTPAENQVLPGRLGRNFVPPDFLDQHINDFNTWVNLKNVKDKLFVQQWLGFYEEALRKECGIIEIQTSFLTSITTNEFLQNNRSLPDRNKKESDTIEILDDLVLDLDKEPFGSDGKKAFLYSVLISQIKSALERNEPVSFGNRMPHDVITEALHQVVFVSQNKTLTPRFLRVAYTDGSESEPFPVLCLHEQPKQTDLNRRILRSALMSMRHFELDALIDFCWFRNRDVSKTRTLAETDSYCYKVTTQQLKESLDGGSLFLEMYHTGFEPAVLGFYRGVVWTLLDRTNRKESVLQVTPMYYSGDDCYEPGQIWN